MSICGRCRGRLVIKASTGIAMVPCPDCRDGIKTARSGIGRGKVSVPLPVGATCKVCGDPAVHHHHVISQQSIDKGVPAEHTQAAKTDLRNLLPACAECHANIHAGCLHLEAHELHPDFAEFVAEYDLEPWLPRHMRAAA